MRCRAPSRRRANDSISHPLLATPRERRSGGRSTGVPHDFVGVGVSAPAAGGYALAGDEREKEHGQEAIPGAFAGQASAVVAPATGTTAPAPTPGCTISSATIESAPDGTADNRPKVGIHEAVELTTGAAANWTASAGTPAAATAKDPFVWTAPDTAGTATIHATSSAPAAACSIALTVVTPASLKFSKKSEDAYAAGVEGAGMRCDVDVQPLDVSFAHVAWLEVPGPAAHVTGYWADWQKRGSDISHHPNPNWVPLNNLNGASDHAFTFRWPKPWKGGAYDWSIPNKFRPVGSSGAGTRFATTLQSFAIAADGTTTVSKESESVSRTP
jgi:hypothetical protein